MTITHALNAFPEDAALHSVTAQPVHVAGRDALRVELLDEITAVGIPGVDYIDRPTFVRIPAVFRTGTIEVDVLSRLNGKTTFDARGFAGVAYRIADDLSTFESVYVRPLNGIRLEPHPPRNRRAVQYFAYPDFPFDRLREDYPDGRYEADADIAPDQWIRLRVEVGEHDVTAFVDGHRVLSVAEPLGVVRSGDVGLFVDIGSEAFFSDLRVVEA